MRNFKSFLIEKPNGYYLKSIFNRLNSKMWPNNIKPLPLIPISYAKLPKGTSGVCKYSMRRIGSHVELIEGTLKIYINKEFNFSSSLIDAIVAHEMIHAQMAFMGKYNESHGSLFKQYAIMCGQRLGIEIPLNHDIGEEELKYSKSVSHFVLIANKNGKTIFALFKDNASFSSMVLKDRYAKYIDRGIYQAIKLQKLSTKLHYTYKVNQKVIQPSHTFYEMQPKDSALFGDVLEVLWDLSK